MADNKLQSTIEIFNQRFFRIPDFQRGYAWGKDELEDFWEDLTNLSEDRTHYTGMLTVESVKKDELKNKKWKGDLWLIEKGLKPYYLVDGQQRITTAIILIKVILDNFKDGEPINYEPRTIWISKFLYQCYGDIVSFIFGYEKDNPSDEYFKTKILGQKSVSARLYSEETLYTHNLEQAKKFLSDKIKNIDKKELKKLFVKLLNSFKFNLYEIDDEIDVYVAFETMNNRGKDLSNLELLKNRLIYLTTLLYDDDNHKTKLRKSINDAWKTVYEYLGRNRKNPLKDDDFLYNHWIMCFKFEKTESEAYAKFLMHEYFTPRNIIDKKLGYKEIFNYVDSISKSIILWYKLFNPNETTFIVEIREYLSKLLRLGHASFSPIILTALFKDVNDKKMLELLIAVEKFIFTVFNLNLRPSNTKSNYFFRMANDFYTGNKSINEVIDDINTLLTTDEEYTGWFTPEDLKLKINDLFERDQGFFSWKGLRYFLYEYELHLQKNARGELKVKWENINQESIEHIYPQASNKPCWKNDFKKYSPRVRSNMLNSLGNLLLLSRSKNSEWSNECFDFKKKHKDKRGNRVGYFNGSYSEIEVSEYKNWTPKEILNRGLKMLNFIETNWNVKVGNTREKKEILHIELV